MIGGRDEHCSLQEEEEEERRSGSCSRLREEATGTLSDDGCPARNAGAGCERQTGVEAGGGGGRKTGWLLVPISGPSCAVAVQAHRKARGLLDATRRRGVYWMLIRAFSSGGSLGDRTRDSLPVCSV